MSVYAGLWARTVFVPLLLSIGIALIVNPWIQELEDYAQIGIGLGAGMMAFVMNVATNKHIRDGVKLTVSKPFLFRDKTV